MLDRLLTLKAYFYISLYLTNVTVPIINFKYYSNYRTFSFSWIVKYFFFIPAPILNLISCFFMLQWRALDGLGGYSLPWSPTQIWLTRTAVKKPRSHPWQWTQSFVFVGLSSQFKDQLCDLWRRPSNQHSLWFCGLCPLVHIRRSQFLTSFVVFINNVFTF